MILFSDALVRDAMNEMLRNKYGLSSPEDASDEVRTLLIRDLRASFNSPVSQIARVVCCQVKIVSTALGL